MKMIQRMLSLLLAFLITFSTTFPIKAGAIERSSTDYDSALILCEGEDGLYREVNVVAKGGIVVYPDDGNEIYRDGTLAPYMRVSNNCFLKAEELVIDVDQPNSFLKIAESYKLGDQLISDVNLILSKTISGEIELSEPLTIYVPAQDHEEMSYSMVPQTPRTYVGYKDRTYYEEILQCKGNSLEFTVKNLPSTTKDYWTKVFFAGVETLVNGYMDSKSGGVWSIASIFGQSTTDSIQTTLAGKHTAKLFENKYIKYTYVVQDNEKFLGSVIDYSYDVFFENFINVDGKDFLSNGRTPHFLLMAPGYDKADQYAYQNYWNNSYRNSIVTYWYESQDGTVRVKVDSLF